MSHTLSRSKKRLEGIRFSRKVWRPLRGEVGRNHVEQRATVRGDVEILEGGFFLRASESSEGVTRYDENDRWEVMAMYLENVEVRGCREKELKVGARR